jgi:translation elongation factor EF-Tu-like GTPase
VPCPPRLLAPPQQGVAAAAAAAAPALQFTLVDCPGHASLIRTIIGGAQIIDMMLLVVESERDSRENLQQANELLLKSNAAVGTILNKSKNYLPTFLRHELPA